MADLNNIREKAASGYELLKRLGHPELALEISNLQKELAEERSKLVGQTDDITVNPPNPVNPLIGAWVKG